MDKALKVIFLAILSSGCSANNSPYNAEIVSEIATKSLPQNADLKMLDGDIVKFAAKRCEFDLPSTEQPTQCDVFVQSENDGDLLGYIIISKKPNGVWVDSDIKMKIPSSETRAGCGISGKIFDFMSNTPYAPPNISGDFLGRMDWQAWQKEPNEWMYVADDGSETQAEIANAQRGTWYFEKKGNNLLLSQDRWNYCSDKVVVKEVFRKVVTLTKK